MPKIAQCICGEMIRECQWEKCKGYVSGDGTEFSGWWHIEDGSHFCRDGRMAMPQAENAEIENAETSTGS